MILGEIRSAVSVKTPWLVTPVWRAEYLPLTDMGKNLTPYGFLKQGFSQRNTWKQVSPKKKAAPAVDTDQESGAEEDEPTPKKVRR